MQTGYCSARRARSSAASLLTLLSPADPAAQFANEDTVANIKSQIKRNKQNERDRERNKAVKSELRTRVKSAVASAGTENADEALRTAIKRIDMAAAKGIIHKNQAANRKSGLMRRLNGSAN